MPINKFFPSCEKSCVAAMEGLFCIGLCLPLWRALLFCSLKRSDEVKIISKDKTSYNAVFFRSLIMAMLIFPIFVPLLTKYSDKKKNNLKWIGIGLGLLVMLAIIVIGRGSVHITNRDKYGYILLVIGLIMLILDIVAITKIAVKNKSKGNFNLSDKQFKQKLKNFYLKFGILLDENTYHSIMKKIDLLSTPMVISDFSPINSIASIDSSPILFDYIPKDIPTLDNYKMGLILNIYNISASINDAQNIIPKIVMPSIDNITEEDLAIVIAEDIIPNIHGSKYYRYNYEIPALGIIIGCLESIENKTFEIENLIKRLYNYAKSNGYKKTMLVNP